MSTKIDGVTLGGDGGGSLRGYVEASYADLVELLGPPNTRGDEYKVSTEWTVTHRNCVWHIYDYKETSTYSDDLPSVEEFRALPSYNWHIGGDGDPAAFIEAVKAALASLRRL